MDVSIVIPTKMVGICLKKCWMPFSNRRQSMNMK